MVKMIGTWHKETVDETDRPSKKIHPYPTVFAVMFHLKVFQLVSKVKIGDLQDQAISCQ
jgi:hypothetical protein